MEVMIIMGLVSRCTSEVGVVDEPVSHNQPRAMLRMTTCLTTKDPMIDEEKNVAYTKLKTSSVLKGFSVSTVYLAFSLRARLRVRIRV